MMSNNQTRTFLVISPLKFKSHTLFRNIKLLYSYFMTKYIPVDKSKDRLTAGQICTVQTSLLVCWPRKD